MTTDMHLTYLITPVDLSAWDRRGPDWSCLYQMLHSLQVGPCYTIYVGCRVYIQGLFRVSIVSQAASCCYDRTGCTSKPTAVLPSDCCLACQLLHGQKWMSQTDVSAAVIPKAGAYLYTVMNYTSKSSDCLHCLPWCISPPPPFPLISRRHPPPNP